jgi:hypothetical protein
MASKKTYENAATRQREQLDPNAAETKRRVEAGELREVQDQDDDLGQLGTGR